MRSSIKRLTAAIFYLNCCNYILKPEEAPRGPIRRMLLREIGPDSAGWTGKSEVLYKNILKIFLRFQIHVRGKGQDRIGGILV